MKIEHEQIGTVEVLSPIGPLVDEGAEAFTQQILARVRSSNPRVVASLREVPYMDSCAIEGLLEATDELSSRAMNLRLVETPPTCREILELVGVAGQFAFFPDVQSAVRSFL